MKCFKDKFSAPASLTRLFNKRLDNELIRENKVRLAGSEIYALSSVTEKNLMFLKQILAREAKLRGQIS